MASNEPIQRDGRFIYQLTEDRSKPDRLINRFSAMINFDNQGFTDATEREIEGVAQLFTAAPDLLASLKELVAKRDLAPPQHRDGEDGRYARARAAIAKAEVSP